MITGGFDEIIRLYDLKQKKEKGQLIGHEGILVNKFVLMKQEQSLVLSRSRTLLSVELKTAQSLSGR